MQRSMKRLHYSWGELIILWHLHDTNDAGTSWKTRMLAKFWRVVHIWNVIIQYDIFLIYVNGITLKI